MDCSGLRRVSAFQAALEKTRKSCPETLKGASGNPGAPFRERTKWSSLLLLGSLVVGVDLFPCLIQDALDFSGIRAGGSQ